MSPRDPLGAVCPAVSLRTLSAPARRGPRTEGVPAFFFFLGANFQLFSQLVICRHPGVPTGQRGGCAPASRP